MTIIIAFNMRRVIASGLSSSTPQVQVFDVLIIGAGFSGCCLLHHFREQDFLVRVVEAASGPGGTWQWNRYPGMFLVTVIQILYH